MVLIRVFCLLLCLTVHEVAHGFAAYKLGDSTAKDKGRLTLNPIPHIDPVGGLLLLFTGFGWAKPVPVNARNFTRKISMRNGMAITAFAGPLSNLIFGFITMFIWTLFVRFNIFGGLDSNLREIILLLLMVLTSMNIGLAVFNLLPIPPLDGSWILSAWLPDRLLNRYFQFERVGRIVLLALLFFPINNPPLLRFLTFLMNYVRTFYLWVIGLLPFM